MTDEDLGMTSEMRAIVVEEEALFERVRAGMRLALARGSGRAGDLRSIEAFRELRDEAAAARAEDLPAMLTEMNVRKRLIERHSKAPMPDPLSPYLAHLRVDEGKGERDYLLGHVTFLDAASGIRIVDWRVAPIAQIFYRYREGDSYVEDFPGRLAEGIVRVRRIVVIEGGVLTRIVGDGIALSRSPDGRWRAADRGALSMEAGGAGTAARPGILGVGIGSAGRAREADITALLDAEQYAAISSPPERPLLVLGSAGSGKTTVALHRLSTIAARDPRRYPLSKMNVIVPEEGLARLSRRLLEPIGAAEAHVKTLDGWSCELAHAVFGRKLPLCPYPPPLVTTLKRHPALYHALRDRFGELAPGNTTLDRLRRRVGEALTDREFLGRVVAASRGGIRTSAIEETVRHTGRQLAERDGGPRSAITDPAMKEAVDGRPLWEGTSEELAGTFDVDDLPILLFLRAWRHGSEGPRLSQLVLDEAEDFSPFELFVLGRLLRETASVTLAGDEAQQTDSGFAGWESALATLGLTGAATCRLTTSYRCPRPVMELARHLLGSLAPEPSRRPLREGAPVGFFRFPTEAQAGLFLAGALGDLLDREPRASIGVIARDADAAVRFHRLIQDLPDARLVLHGEFSFDAGIDVTDVDNAKGLEFDYVAVPDASSAAYPVTDEARRRLHVAVTRASHQLWIVSSGTPTPLLSGFDTASA